MLYRVRPLVYMVYIYIYIYIYCEFKINQICRIKKNEELDKLIKHENVVNYIKAQRLS